MSQARGQKLSRVSYFARLVLRVLQVILSIAVVGTAGHTAAGFQGEFQCTIPDKINYNIAAVGPHSKLLYVCLSDIA